ncbi:MAG: metal ABC transporter permease [Elusimicrobia bacterium]|nr:metal ABC transporter permease [Elusimicrobiota bacterium]
MLEIMLPAFFVSIILIGIHSYLGLHILARGVIFADLSLAQLAACGAIVSIFFGQDLHSRGSYFFSLAFTLLGSVIFSFYRGGKNKEIPQEAVIGIVYVLSAAVSILILDKLPAEAQHIKEMLVGNILFVSKEQIIKTAFLYSFIGILHYFFRDKFMSISFNPAKSENLKNLRMWDFLFYSLFGVVVTSSVELAGVFLVFTFLIIPAVISVLLCGTFKSRIIFSWFSGTLITMIGLFLSAKLDSPTGPTVIASFGFFLTIVSIFTFLKSKYFSKN